MPYPLPVSSFGCATGTVSPNYSNSSHGNIDHLKNTYVATLPTQVKDTNELRYYKNLKYYINEIDKIFRTSQDFKTFK